MDEPLDKWLDYLDLDSIEKRRARFVVDVLTDGIAPTNNLLANPAVLKSEGHSRW